MRSRLIISDSSISAHLRDWALGLILVRPASSAQDWIYHSSCRQIKEYRHPQAFSASFRPRPLLAPGFSGSLSKGRGFGKLSHRPLRSVTRGKVLNEGGFLHHGRQRETTFDASYFRKYFFVPAFAEAAPRRQAFVATSIREVNLDLFCLTLHVQYVEEPVDDRSEENTGDAQEGNAAVQGIDR